MMPLYRILARPTSNRVSSDPLATSAMRERSMRYEMATAWKGRGGHDMATHGPRTIRTLKTRASEFVSSVPVPMGSAALLDVPCKAFATNDSRN